MFATGFELAAETAPTVVFAVGIALALGVLLAWGVAMADTGEELKLD